MWKITIFYTHKSLGNQNYQWTILFTLNRTNNIVLPLATSPELKIDESIQEIFDILDDMIMDDRASSPIHLFGMDYTTTNAQSTQPPVLSPIRTIDAGLSLDSALIQREDEQLARIRVLGINTPDAYSSLLESSDSNNKHNTESEYIESSTTPSITTTNNSDSVDECQTRGITELSDDDTVDTAMDMLPYANHYVTTNEMTEWTTNQNWLLANREMFFQNKGLSQNAKNICEECGRYIKEAIRTKEMTSVRPGLVKTLLESDTQTTQTGVEIRSWI